MTNKIYLIFLIIPSLVNASVLLNDKTVKRIHVNLDSGIYFQTVQAMENLDGCNSISWYHIKPNSTYEKEALSILLSAKMSNKKVQFYLNDCANGFPSVNYINLYN